MIAQVWKNSFGSLAPIQKEEEGRVIAKIQKGSELSFGMLSVIVEQMQNEVKAPLTLSLFLEEDGSFSVSVQEPVALTEEITDIKEEDKKPTKKKAKKEAVENAISAEEGE